MGVTGATKPTEARSAGDSAGIRRGYRRTELGVLPDDWDCVQLRELTSHVGSGITPTGGARVYTSDGRPFLRSQNVGWGTLDLSDIAFITDDIHATFSATEIEEGDVLLNITGASIGRSAVADERVMGGNVNQHVCEIRTDREKLDPRYLASYLLSASGQRQIESFQAGGNRQGLNYGQIRSFLVPRPPLTEQRAIAEALSDVDGLLGALEALIAKKRGIKQAVMQRLLTGKTRLPGFSGQWATKRLTEIVDVDPENLSNTTRPDHRFNYISLEQVNAGRLLGYSEETFDTAPSRARRVLRYGDVLMSTVRPQLMAHLLYRDQVSNAVCSTGFAVLRPKPSMSESEFILAHLFGHVLNHQIDRVLAGSNYPAISSGDVKMLEIPCPPKVEEQTAIAAVLSDLDGEVFALERRRDKTRAIKHGLMQELLTGRVRLVRPVGPKVDA